MRIPFIIALLVVLTLPKDVHGLVEDMSTQVRTASAAVTKFLGRNDPVQVAALSAPTDPAQSPAAALR